MCVRALGCAGVRARGPKPLLPCCPAAPLRSRVIILTTTESATQKEKSTLKNPPYEILSDSAIDLNIDIVSAIDATYNGRVWFTLLPRIRRRCRFPRRRGRLRGSKFVVRFDAALVLEIDIVVDARTSRARVSTPGVVLTRLSFLSSLSRLSFLSSLSSLRR